MTHKTVPYKATAEMIEAGRWSEYDESSPRPYPVCDDAVTAVWEQMYDAAPAAEPPEIAADSVSLEEIERAVRRTIAAEVEANRTIARRAPLEQCDALCDEAASELCIALSLITRALAARPAFQAIPHEIEVLDRDRARIALWEAIRSIKLGNPTDDKLILDALRDSGVWLHRFDNHPMGLAARPAVPELQFALPNSGAKDQAFVKGWNACRAAMLAAAPSPGDKM